MDEIKIKIVNFFNDFWIKSIKSKYLLYLTTNVGELRFEYDRVFGVKLSTSQIVELLIKEELEKVKEKPSYSGKYHDINLTKVRSRTNLIKRAEL